MVRCCCCIKLYLLLHLLSVKWPCQGTDPALECSVFTPHAVHILAIAQLSPLMYVSPTGLTAGPVALLMVKRDLAELPPLLLVGSLILLPLMQRPWLS